jgi:hypothetical protein
MTIDRGISVDTGWHSLAPWLAIASPTGRFDDSRASRPPRRRDLLMLRPGAETTSVFPRVPSAPAQNWDDLRMLRAILPPFQQRRIMVPAFG